jgi:uncharacterized glyoxalase superfamily protein PhnB
VVDGDGWRGRRRSTVPGDRQVSIPSYKTGQASIGHRGAMSEASKVKLWHSMSCSDAEAMMRWLRAIGFTEHATIRDPQDPSLVAHAEWLWPGGGGIMFGSEREDGGVHNAGRSSAYLVTDEPDAVFDKAIAAGGTVVRAMVDNDYGGRSGTVADPEGNQWSVGSYAPS